MPRIIKSAKVKTVKPRRFFIKTLCFLLLLLNLCWIHSAFAAVIFGNPKGSVTLEFVYDYQCIHCHRMYPIIQALLDQDKDLRIQLYPVAVINNNSLLEASAAVAATRYPDKFQELTTILMSEPPMNSQMFTELIQHLGLNQQNFFNDMHGQWVEKELLEGLNQLKTLQVKEIPLIVIKATQQTNIPPKIFVGEQPPDRLVNVLSAIHKEIKEITGRNQ